METNRKGIILAGGTGSRLFPITLGISKQLLPIYDKPMIYYSISTLMLSGIRDILIICTPFDLERFKELLGDGSLWGISLKYSIQEKPEGIAQAFRIAEPIFCGHNIALALGDNLFYGHDLTKYLSRAAKSLNKATIFAYRVSDPERYGVVNWRQESNGENKVISIVEKPIKPKSNYAVTGLYFYDEKVFDYAKQISPSKRGELEITDINNIYLKKEKLNVELLSRGLAWLDTGTFDSLLQAGNFISMLEKRQGLKISCPEEVAWRKGWISSQKLYDISISSIKSGYGLYLRNLLEDKK